jgi:hypothetical protein
MLHWACIRRYFTGPRRLFKGECLTSFSPFFLLCPFAKCNIQFIVTRIASAFYGPSLFCFFTHICLLSCFISFFWIFVGRKDGRCAHKSRWSQKLRARRRCYLYRFNFASLHDKNQRVVFYVNVLPCGPGNTYCPNGSFTLH